MNIAWTIRRIPKTARNAVRDLRYGGLLGGTITTRHADLGARDIGNSDYDALDQLFAGIEIRPSDVLVDVGCGKGRVLNWFLMEHPRNRVYGIELDPDVCARTAKRLRRYRNVTVLCGDATKLLPEDATLYHLFNPFDESVMTRFADAVLQSDLQGRRIVYHRPKHLAPFERNPRFEVSALAGTAHNAAVLISVK